MARWGRIHDSIVRWVFEADAPPTTASLAQYQYLNLDTHPQVEEGFILDPSGSFIDARPPKVSPLERNNPKTKTPEEIVSVLARQVPALTTEAVGYIGNVWIRVHKFTSVGEVHAGHQHKFDHVSFLMKGRARVTVEGRSTDYSAVNFIKIDKGLNHEIVALEDGTEWWCVFAVRDDNGEVAEVVNEAQHDPMFFAAAR